MESKLKTFIGLFFLLLLFLAIPLTVFVTEKIQDVRKRASGAETVIGIDVAKEKPLPRVWQNLAQGGETPLPQLPDVVTQTQALSPRYIRLDHIFDAYKVVTRNEQGEIIYDFSLLDSEVAAIQKIGAIPFFSLSYVPSDIADKGNESRPVYNLWQTLVAKTIAHYSGKTGKNIANVYYEVYNEPDLFGKWSVDEYMQLYEASVNGAREAGNTNTYFIGGPAISYFSQSFIKTFLEEAEAKELQVDFVSWHTYSTDPKKISKDADALSEIVATMPSFTNIVKVVSEWGSYPEKHAWHDTILDNSHLVATIAQSLAKVDMLFYFEIKDGKNSASEKFFGGWGILTNDVSGTIVKKPRYYALSLVNKLKQLQYEVSGQNENIFAIASGNSSTDLTLLLTYYSFGSGNAAFTIPVHLDNALPGQYEVSKTILDDVNPPKKDDPFRFTVTKNEGSFTIPLTADMVALLDINRVSPATELIDGESGGQTDKAALISQTTSTLLFPLPAGEIPKRSEITFSLKVDSLHAAQNETTLFESHNADTAIRLTSDSQSQPTCTLSVVTGGVSSLVSLPVPSTFLQEWHKVTMLFDNTRALLELRVDGKVVQGALKSNTKLPEIVSFAGENTVSSFEGAVDNIRIVINDKTILSESF